MEIRQLNTYDSLEDLTAMIHRAYRRLAEMGFRYWATHQSVEDTRKRIASGECYVAVQKGILIGTIKLTPPDAASPHPWYARPDVASFHQFAVDPDHQGQGIGSQLLEHIEQRAVELGAAELACDTADRASHLIDFYHRRGYRTVDTANWDMTNYTSIILSKTL